MFRTSAMASPLTAVQGYEIMGGGEVKRKIFVMVMIL